MALSLAGLSTRPAQTWGGVRVVPLIRESPIEDLRLDARLYDADVGIVLERRSAYISYIPHGFVARWARDGGPAAAYGTQLVDPGGRDRPPERMGLRFHRRMARRIGKDRLRFLPLHLALEGYLALHFGGPTLAWEEWSSRALRGGLSPRVEEAYVGAAVRGLADALAVFEIHPAQCGVLVHVADSLATAFVVPHPDDYRALHPSLIQDLYGELIHQYGLFGAPVPEFRARLAEADVHGLADLRDQARRQLAEWAAFHDGVMAGGLLGGRYTFRRARRMGPYELSRFLPEFRRRAENHIGECITGQDGRVAYLKTFRLSENQVRRGHLLTRLDAAGWSLAGAAGDLGVTPEALALRLDAAGFGHLLRPDVLDHYRARSRRDG